MWTADDQNPNTRPNFLHGRRLVLRTASLALWLALSPSACNREEPRSATPASAPSASASAPAQPGEAAEAPRASTAAPANTDVELIGVPSAWRAAIVAAKQAAETAPKDAKTIGRLGMLYMSADLPTHAARYFKKANELDPGGFNWLYYLGIAYERAYAPVEAVKAIRAALAIDDRHVPALLRLSELLRVESPEESRSLLLRASTLAPEECRVTFGLARHAMERGELDEAAAQLEKTVELAPDFGTAHGMLAEAYTQMKREADAERHRSLSKQADLLPDMQDRYWSEMISISREVLQPLEFADMLTRQGNLTKAADVLRHALEVDPENAIARQRYGGTLSMLGRHDEAIAEMRKVAAAAPDSIDLQINLVSSLVEARRYDEAEAVFKDLLARADAPTIVQRAYSMYLLLVGRAAEAIPLLESLSGQSEAGGQDSANLLLAYACTRQFEKAVEQYAQFKKGLPENQSGAQILAGVMIGMMLRQQNAEIPAEKEPAHLRPQHFVLLADAFAEQGMQEESQATRDYVHVLAGDAMRLAETGRFDDALSYLNEVMPVDMGGILLNTKGAVCGMKGDPEQALACFEEALEINPNLSPAKSAKVQALMDLGRTQEAGELLDEIVKERPNDPMVLQAHALMLARANRFDDALAFLGRAAEMQPDNPTHFRIRAELLARLARLDEAMADANAALKIAPDDAAARHLLAVCLHAAGRVEEARTEWRKIVEANPRLIESRMALVELAFGDGDTRQAQTLLREGLRATPQSPLLANALAWSLATCTDPALRHGREAVQYATQACEATKYQQVEFVDTLAAAYAEAGDFRNAAEMQKRAIAAAEKAGNTAGAEGFKKRLALYESGKTYRE